MTYPLSLRSFKQAEDGATAVEFALISPLLFFIFMAIIEISLMFFASVNLNGAAIEAARRIRTGQTQVSGNPEADFTNSLCGQLDTIITCDEVFYDARTVTSFNGVSLDIAYDPDTGEPITYGFNTGGSGDIVLVRVMYAWSITTPTISAFFETSPGTSNRMLSSTVVFKTEPYE